MKQTVGPLGKSPDLPTKRPHLDRQEELSTDSAMPVASRQTVIRGILAVGLASVIMRGGGFAAHIFAGYLLTAEDFGLFAAVLGFTTISASLLSALRPLFIERLSTSQPVDGLWRTILLGLTIIAVLLWLGAGPISMAVGRPEASSLFRLVAPTLPLQFAQVIGVARLSAQHRFAEASTVMTLSALSRHGSLVIFAYLGFGVSALVLPIYIESIFQLVLLWKKTGPLPNPFGPIRGVISRYRGTLGWIFIAAVGLALSISGDYTFISPLETATVVGFYFFGYQLSAALTQPFTMAATSVLVPSFASVTNDAERLRRTFLEAISLLLVTSSFAFGLLAIASGPLIEFVWSGRWDPSIAVVTVVAVGTPFRILQPICYSLLQAGAQWKRLAGLMSVGAFTAIVPTVIGAMLGGLGAIALGASIGAMAGGTIAAVTVANSIGIKQSASISTLLRSAITPLLGLAAAYSLIPGFQVSVGWSVARMLIYLLATVPAALALYGDALRDLIGHARNR